MQFFRFMRTRVPAHTHELIDSVSATLPFSISGSVTTPFRPRVRSQALAYTSSIGKRVLMLRGTVT